MKSVGGFNITIPQSRLARRHLLRSPCVRIKVTCSNILLSLFSHTTHTHLNTFSCINGNLYTVPECNLNCVRKRRNGLGYFSKIVFGRDNSNFAGPLVLDTGNSRPGVSTVVFWQTKRYNGVPMINSFRKNQITFVIRTPSVWIFLYKMREYTSLLNVIRVIETSTVSFE